MTCRMNIDDLRREAIRCRNLGNRIGENGDAAWYRDRGIRLTRAADALSLAEADGAAETN